MAQRTLTISGVIEVKCNAEWNDCQKKQACSKIRRMDRQAKAQVKNTGDGLRKITPQTNRRVRKQYERRRKAGNEAAAKYEGTNYAHDCMKPKQGRAENQGRSVQADHIHEIQLGGGPEGPFMWLDSAVNGSIGKSIDNSKVNNVTGFKAKDCGPHC